MVRHLAKTPPALKYRETMSLWHQGKKLEKKMTAFNSDFYWLCFAVQMEEIALGK